MAHRDGVATHLLCLTDGQAAHHRGEASDDAELGRIRRAELAAACEVLGVTNCEILHYPDGGCRSRTSTSLPASLPSASGRCVRKWC